MSTCMDVCTVGQTQRICWQPVLGNAIDSLNDQALTEESGAYSIFQTISHNLIPVSVGFDRFTWETKRYTYAMLWTALITNWIMTKIL